MLADFKPILASRTVWTNIVGFCAVVLAAFGYAPDALGDQGALAEALLQIVTGLAFVASTLFRIAATRRLG